MKGSDPEGGQIHLSPESEQLKALLDALENAKLRGSRRRGLFCSVCSLKAGRGAGETGSLPNDDVAGVAQR